MYRVAPSPFTMLLQDFNPTYKNGLGDGGEFYFARICFFHDCLKICGNNTWYNSNNNNNNNNNNNSYSLVVEKEKVRMS